MRFPYPEAFAPAERAVSLLIKLLPVSKAQHAPSRSSFSVLAKRTDHLSYGQLLGLPDDAGGPTKRR